jgi:hypothetical protein
MSKISLPSNPSDNRAAPFAPEATRRWHDRSDPAQGHLAKLPVPGWPQRGRYVEADRVRLAVMLPTHRRLIEDFVDGMHFEGASPMPWREKSSRAYAYDAFGFALNSLSPFLLSPTSPVLLVTHAALLEWGYNLPAKPTSTRRALEKIRACVRQEQRGAPDAEPDEAGPTCRRYPSIALIVHEQDRRSLPRHGRAGGIH